jgi:5-methyltetrahydrofolate--homocysteine methyltransferase
MTKSDDLYFAILDGDKKIAANFTRQALDEGVDPQFLIDNDMIPAMAEVGKKFEDRDYFVPELLLSARAMKAALVLIRPLLANSDAEPCGCVVLGAVKGDLHDIGKNIVSAMLEGAGFKIHDLGTNVAPARFVEAVKEFEPDLVGLSALLTTTMPSIKLTIDALEQAEVRDQVRIMVGGAPLSEVFAENIGADGFADNATAAVRLAHGLVEDLDRARGRNRLRGSRPLH